MSLSEMIGKRACTGIRTLSALTVASAFLGFAGCDRKQSLAQMPARPPAAVTIATAATRDVPVYLDAIGKAVSIESVSVMPQVGGKIIASHVKDGDEVKKGDLLFEIDPRPLEASLASAEATLAQNKAELDLAKTEYARVERMHATAAVSQSEFDQKRSALAVAEAKIASAQAAIDSAKLNVEYTKIHSPVTGRAGATMVDPGNVVKANEVTLIVIQTLDPIYAEFTVTENDLGTVRKYMAARGLEVGREADLGLKAEVDVPGNSARVLAALGVAGADGLSPTTAPSSRPSTGPELALPRIGTLTFLDNTVQNATGTVRLRATVPNSDRYFWPGQFLNVRLVLTTKKDAVLVPAESQQIGQQGPFVYVVKSDDTAELRPIVPGQRQGNMIVVDRGVSAGERVVVTGQMTVMPGGKVQATNTPAPVAAADTRSAARAD